LTNEDNGSADEGKTANDKGQCYYQYILTSLKQTSTYDKTN
jgi:hypothetical protein